MPPHLEALQMFANGGIPPTASSLQKRLARKVNSTNCPSCQREGVTTYPTASSAKAIAVCGDCIPMYQSYGVKGAGTGRFSDKTNTYAIIEPDKVRLWTTINPALLNVGPRTEVAKIVNPIDIVRELVFNPPVKYSFVVFQSSAFHAANLKMNIDPNFIIVSGNKGMGGHSIINSDIVRAYVTPLNGHFDGNDLKAYAIAKQQGASSKIVEQIEAMYPIFADGEHSAPDSAEIYIARRLLAKKSKPAAPNPPAATKPKPKPKKVKANV